MKADIEIPTDGNETWVVGDRIRFLGGLPGHDLELIVVDVPPGSGTPPHTHASAEMFYIVAGDLTVRLFEGPGAPPTVTVAGPGAAIRIPPRLPHNYANESGAPVRMLALLETSMTAFFRDVGTPEPQVAPDFARLGAAMERHGIDVLTLAA